MRFLKALAKVNILSRQGCGNGLYLDKLLCLEKLARLHLLLSCNFL